MAIDFDKPAQKVISPSKLAHVVLRTNNLEAMITFYKDFLGAEAIYQNDTIAFLTYDEEHHRIAFIQIPETQEKIRTSCGLEHVAFTFDNLSDLLLSYRQRKNKGLTPVWSVNHGPTTSIYYRDPDGNMMETQVDNFDTADDATDFMKTEAFAQNPYGVDFDPEDMIKRLSAGESDEVLKKRVEIGPRSISDIQN